MKKPEISIIIIAYNRKKFLFDAIKSSLNQTLSRNKYEIIVIKNFKDENIDKFIEINGIKNILMEGTLGKFLSEGIKIANGDIISFLDDDDYFNAVKLEKVSQIFEKNKDIVYFHNNHILINEGKKFIKKNGFLESLKINSEELLKKSLNINYFGFNLSSISIKKDYYIKYSNLLTELKTHSDDFILFCALDEPTTIYMDSSYLTYYRVHNSQSNINIYKRNEENIKIYGLRKVSILSSYCEASNYMLKNFENEDLKRLIMIRHKMETIILNYYTTNNIKGIKFNLFRDVVIYILKSQNFPINFHAQVHNTIIRKYFLLFRYTYASISHFSGKSFLQYKFTNFLII